MSFDKIGYTVHPVEEVLKPRHSVSLVDRFHTQQANPTRRTAYTAFVDAIGDGNCGPRSMIQSLLLQGLLHNQQEFVYQFLYQLYTRHHDNIQPYTEYAPYTALPNDPRYPVGQGSVRLPLAQKQELNAKIIKFLNTYHTLQATPESLTYIQNYMPHYGPGRMRPQCDYIIYLLAAYLRFDMVAHIHQNKEQRPAKAGISQIRFDNLQNCLAVADDDMLGDLGSLERNTNLQVTGWYFAEQQIHLQVHGESGDNLVSCMYDNRDDCGARPSRINMAVYRIPGGSHYATLINPEIDRLKPVNIQLPAPRITANPQFVLSAFNTFRNRFLVCILFSACCVGMAIAMGGSAIPIGIGISSLAILGFFTREYSGGSLPTSHNGLACAR